MICQRPELVAGVSSVLDQIIGWLRSGVDSRTNPADGNGHEKVTFVPLDSVTRLGSRIEAQVFKRIAISES